MADRRTDGIDILTSEYSHRKTHNYLLDALPEPVKTQPAPHLHLESLPLGKSIYESGSSLDHVLFPTTAIVSLLYVLENRDTAEVAVVGNEGVVGITLFLGGATMPNRAIVQSAGEAFRLPTNELVMTQELIADML